MKRLAVLFFAFLCAGGFAQTANSVLSTGDWYKVSVNSDGIYRITYDDLLSYGIDVDNINPKNIALFGNGAGMLPESSSAFRYDDLQPVSIFVQGEEDGHFDPQDYILFYGQAAVTLDYNSGTGLFSHSVNYYCDKTFYFLTVGESQGARLDTLFASTEPATDTVTSYKVLLYHENELINPGKTGKEWLGETFDADTLQRVFHLSTDGYAPLSGSHYFKISLANADTGNFDYFNVAVGGRPLMDSIQMPAIAFPEMDFYRLKTQSADFDVTGNNFDVQIDYVPSNETSRGYLNYFEMTLNVSPSFSGDMLNFFSTQHVGEGKVCYYSMDYSGSQSRIWDVSDPLHPQIIDFSVSGNKVNFKLPADHIRNFCLWNGQRFLQPEFEGGVENQNLHALECPDLLIVTPEQFKSYADDLAAFHGTVDNMSVQVVDINKIYNEFSSGKKDPFAIRDFAKYLSEQNEKNHLSYLLLFGKGSYDYKNRIENNTDFVPVIESDYSTNAVNSFASDDYYGIFNDSAIMNVAVGRLPVAGDTQAAAAVQKIIHYSQSAQCFGNWKNNFAVIADDGDNNLHLNFSEDYFDSLSAGFPCSIIAKDYLDLFPLDSSVTPPAYPDVNRIINESVQQGLFFVNYTGHGGQDKLAMENVVNDTMIDNWENFDHLPFWIVSSGGVVKNDDPSAISIGEKMVTKSNGGAVAVLGSTQANFASSNCSFNTLLINSFTGSGNSNGLTFGDMLLDAKNHLSGNDNYRKWNLLGDPALQIAFPAYQTVTTEINGTDITTFSDTVKPGTEVTFSGFVADRNGDIIPDFNGTVLLTFTDMPYIKTTLANQTGSIAVDVAVSDSILTRATGTVENGTYQISVTFPAIYHEAIGKIKGSLYAYSSDSDAAGAITDIVYGGSPAGMDENSGLSMLKVYPTVFSRNVTVFLPQNFSSRVSYNLYDPLGRKIYSQTILPETKVFTIDIPARNRGMYVLQLFVDNQYRSFKLFKE